MPELEALEQARRDIDGFIISAQPHLTEQQIEWLSWRMGCATDEEANIGAMIDQDAVDDWMLDPVFVDVRQKCMDNKREAFKFLTSQMLPKVIRTIKNLLDSESAATQARGINLLLRSQGLLIDKRQSVDKDSIQSLVEALRRPQQVSFIEGEVRELASGQ